MNYTPHIHICELKLLYPMQWDIYCNLKGEISEDEHECDFCEHMIIIEFQDKEHTKINNIVRSENI